MTTILVHQHMRTFLRNITFRPAHDICTYHIIELQMPRRMCGSRGGPGVRTLPEKSQNIGFLINTGPDPLKITKLPIQHSMLDNQQPASETPFKWRSLAGG